MTLALIIFSLLLPVQERNDPYKEFIPKQKVFVKQLFESGMYFDCIAEARRLQYYDPSPETEYFIYTNYFLAKQYLSVASGYSFDGSDRVKALPAMLLVSQAYLGLGQYADSYSSLGPPVYEGFDDGTKFVFFLRRVEPLVLDGDYDALDIEILKAQEGLSGNAGFIELRRELEACRGNEGISPVTGCIMSAIVPGLGQAVSGRFLDAVLSLASVVLPAAGGYYMQQHDETGTAYTLYFFSGLFYAGNVYGGYNSAAVQNENYRKMNHESITGRYGKYDPVIYINFGRVFN